MKPAGSLKLTIVPMSLGDANDLVARWHRHHKPVVGHKFSIGVEADLLGIVGAAICGRPVARMCNQRFTLEVTRLVTDGTPNACSMLYAAAARAATALGYTKIQTYILASESGTTLKAAGWADEGPAGGGDGWKKRNGDAAHDAPTELKHRWAKVLS